MPRNFEVVKGLHRHPDLVIYDSAVFIRGHHLPNLFWFINEMMINEVDTHPGTDEELFVNYPILADMGANLPDYQSRKDAAIMTLANTIFRTAQEAIQDITIDKKFNPKNFSVLQILGIEGYEYISRLSETQIALLASTDMSKLWERALEHAQKLCDQYDRMISNPDSLVQISEGQDFECRLKTSWSEKDQLEAGYGHCRYIAHRNASDDIITVKAFEEILATPSRWTSETIENIKLQHDKNGKVIAVVTTMRTLMDSNVRSSVQGYTRENLKFLSEG